MSTKKPIKSTPQTSGTDTEPDAGTLAKIRRSLPAPSEVERRAYRSQFPDAFCEEKGKLTKGRGALREARRWVVQIFKNRAQPGGDTVRYPPQRLHYLMDCVDALAAALDKQEADQGKAGRLKSGASQAEQEARALAEELHDDLSDVAGEREAEKADLAQATRGEMRTADDVQARLKSLAHLSRQWLASGDETLRALLSTYQVTEASATAADEMAAQLADKGTAASGERVEPRDTPPVNRAEGRVTQEMKLAMNATGRARKTWKDLKPLSPTAATRAAILGRARPKAEPPVTKEPTQAGTPEDKEPAPVKTVAKKRRTRRR